MYTYTPAQKGTRIASMLLDHIAMGIIIVLVNIPTYLALFGFTQTTVEDLHTTTNGQIFMSPYLITLGFSLYFCKDCIGGRSIAKRLTKTIVVTNKTGVAANPLRCLVRNLFIPLWPIEVLYTLASSTPERRIGDLVAGTRVDQYVKGDPDYDRKPLYLQAIFSIAITFLPLATIAFGINRGVQSLFIAPDASTYNATISKEIEQEIENKVSDIEGVSVKIYDKVVQKSNLGYISIVVQVNGSNYFYQNRKTIDATIKGILLQHYDTDTYTGRILYYNKGGRQTYYESIGAAPIYR